MAEKYVYSFGPRGAEGDASMKNSLGGKGANLAEMCRLGLPVPAGFTISTEFCTAYFQEGESSPSRSATRSATALAKTEEAMGMKYGDTDNPLLLSCRSGARKSMPGMMETVLNVGLCPATIPGPGGEVGQRAIRVGRLPPADHDVLRRRDGEGRGHRAGRRQGHPPAARAPHGRAEEGEGLQGRHRHDGRRPQEAVRGVQGEGEASAGPALPGRSAGAAWGAVGAVFKSWQGSRAVSYRRIEGIPEEWGTACNVQSMVFGNLGDTSATGVAFSRNPATGENKFYGEWLVNAQGEDVVAGIRTPNPLNEATKNEQNKHLPRSKPSMPGLYKRALRHPHEARAALPGHAGHRVHDPGGQALHAPVPQRQADRHGGPEHGDGHARTRSSSTK